MKIVTDRSSFASLQNIPATVSAVGIPKKRMVQNFFHGRHVAKAKFALHQILLRMGHFDIFARCLLILKWVVGGVLHV